MVAQAVSLLRAEQTGVWFETAQERQEPQGEPDFGFGQVRDLVRLIEDHNAAWGEWFASAGVQPCLVQYEDLDADPVRVASKVLAFLGLDPAGRSQKPAAIRQGSPAKHVQNGHGPAAIPASSRRDDSWLLSGSARKTNMVWPGSAFTVKVS